MRFVDVRDLAEDYAARPPLHLMVAARFGIRAERETHGRMTSHELAAKFGGKVIPRGG